MAGPNDIAPMPNRGASLLRILLILVLAFQTVWVGVYVAPKPFFTLSGLPITDWGTETQLVFWALLMPCIAAFWPLLRFVGLPLDAQSQIRPVSWTLWLSAAVMFMVSSVSLPAPSPLALSGSLAPLALPIAVWMAWRWKERATVPLIIGGLPFLFYVDLGWIKFPGGVWPLLAILFWSRFVRDGELRGRLLRREHLGWGELALIMLVLSHSAGFPAGQLLGHNVTLTVRPAWMLTTVALIIGASRMPRGRFAIAAVLAAVAYLFASFFQTYLFPRLPFPHYEPQLGFHDYLTLLIALLIVPFVRRAQSSDLAGFLGLQRRTAPIVDSAASQNTASPRFAAVGRAFTALDPGTLPFSMITLWTFASIASGLAPSLFLNGSPSGLMETFAFPGQESLALIAMTFGIVLAVTRYRMAVSIGLGVLSLIWLIDTSALFGNHYASWQLATLPNGAHFGVGLGGLAFFSPAGLRSWASIIVVGGFGLFGFVLPYAIKQSPESFSPLQKLNARLTSFLVEAALNRSGRTARPAGASDHGSRK